MLEKIFHWLTGCVRFQVTGDAARFFNIAAKSGLGLWGFQKEGTDSAAWIRAGEYKKLRGVKRRCGAGLHILHRQGLPFQINRVWKRKGLILGGAGGILLYMFLSTFVWNVSVTGEELLTEAELLRAGQTNGIYVGAGRDSFRPNEAAYGIMGEVKGISWATVNTDGCFVEISVKEGEKKPEITDDTKLSNIVAAREGKVVALEAHHGRPEVSLGDTVEAGQLLISGVYTQEVDPYGPQPEHPLVTYGAARGSVKAETYREFTVQVSGVKRIKQPSGEKKVNLSLELFGLQLPLGFNTIPEEEYHTYTEENALTALDVRLPVAVKRQVYESLIEKERRLTEEEMKDAALLKLREAQKAAVAQGGRVIKEDLQYTFADGMCILTAKCRCEEEIGEQKTILVN